MPERAPSFEPSPRLSGRELIIAMIGATGFRIEQGPNAHSPEKLEAALQITPDPRLAPTDRVEVKEGVICEVYEFPDDPNRDLGIIEVQPGCKTPLQRVLSGNETIEGYLSGKGTLAITRNNGDTESYSFPGTDETLDQEVIVEIGDIMQWEASETESLVFYEICDPPYEDGRYENLD